MSVNSAVRRSTILKNKKIKTHNITSSYSTYNFLIALKGVDVTRAAIFERKLYNKFSWHFVSSYQLKALNIERGYLYEHIIKNSKIMSIVRLILKISSNSTLSQIKSKMETGSPLTQVSRYTKIYDEIKRKAVPEKYMRANVATMPASKYYLSKEAKILLSGSSKRR